MSTPFCDIKQQEAPRCGVAGDSAEGGPDQLAKVYGNTILNFNVSTPDVQCGSTMLNRSAFLRLCGMDIGTSTPTRPSVGEIRAMVRQWMEGW